MRKFLLATVAAAAISGAVVAAPVNEETLRWAFQGDAQSLDPYSLN